VWLRSLLLRWNRLLQTGGEGGICWIRSVLEQSRQTCHICLHNSMVLVVRMTSLLDLSTLPFEVMKTLVCL
jgi:hypothetical protein